MGRRSIVVLASVLVLVAVIVPTVVSCHSDPVESITSEGPVRDGGDARLDPPEPATLAVLADSPYGHKQRAEFDELIDGVNDETDVEWVVHLGDIKSGPSSCDDDALRFVARRFARLRAPLVYTPGDNEWTDCHQPGAGSFDPLERLRFVRGTFFPSPGETIGGRRAEVDTQSSEAPWSEFVENVGWTLGGVRFATVHLVGSRNGQTPWTNETPEEAVRREAEVTRRTAAAVAWIDRTFDLAEDEDLAGVVIAMHADMWAHVSREGDDEGDDGAGGGATDVFAAVRRALAARSSRFDRPVLVLEGDSHGFQVDEPFSRRGSNGPDTDEAPKVTRIVVPGDTVTQWLRLRVDPTATAVFEWEVVDI